MTTRPEEVIGRSEERGGRGDAGVGGGIEVFSRRHRAHTSSQHGLLHCWHILGRRIVRGCKHNAVAGTHACKVDRGHRTVCGRACAVSTSGPSHWSTPFLPLHARHHRSCVAPEALHAESLRGRPMRTPAIKATVGGVAERHQSSAKSGAAYVKRARLPKSKRFLGLLDRAEQSVAV